MTLTPRQIRGIQYKRQRQEQQKELESRARYGGITAADLAAVHEANRSLVECWMTPNGDVFCPSCAAKRPRNAFRYSADPDTTCARCHQPVSFDEQSSNEEHARRQADIEDSCWRNS